MTQQLEDEDDYIIIERSQSASGASSSSAHRSARSIRIPPPPSMVVPLITESVVAPSSLARSLAGMKFTSGAPRGEALKQVAFLLEDLGGSRQQAGAHAESLVFRLLALQVLEAASECSQPKLPSGESSEGPSNALAMSPKSDHLKSYMKVITEKAVQDVDCPRGTQIAALEDQKGTIKCLRRYLLAKGLPQLHEPNMLQIVYSIATTEVSQLLGEEGKKEPLPDVWELAFKAALSLAKGAAVDELLSNYQPALRSYSKAGALLYFIFAEGSELPLEPKLLLSPIDTVRLQRYTACVALRHQDCAARLKLSKESLQK